MTEAAALYDAGIPATKKDPDIQQIMLREFMGTEVSVHVVSGAKLMGRITAHDRYTIVLDARLLVFKHAITSIRQVRQLETRWNKKEEK